MRIAMIVLGVILGVIGVLFCSKIYNPFDDTVDSPLALMPDDMDFVLNVPDFPTLMKEVRQREFVVALDEHEGFQSFLKTRWARDSGLPETLRKVFRTLDDVSDMPLGLDLLGDVSGEQVTVGGYFPAKKDGDIRFMAVFQPGDWKTIAGVNVLLDEQLCNWFVREHLEAEGIDIEHRRDQVRLDIPDWDQDLWITRIADTVIVSTEERQLARIRGSVEKHGLPQVASRYDRIHNASGDHHALVLARRKKADRFLELEKKLLEAWGPEDLDLAESVIPRVGGQDMIAALHVGRGLGLQISGELGDLEKDDISQLFQGFRKLDLQDTLDAYANFLPEEVFGIVHMNARFGQLAQSLFDREDVFSHEENELLNDYLKSTPIFGNRVAFFDMLTRHADNALSIVFFTQPRGEIKEQAQPGYALVAPVSDQDGLMNLLARLEAEIKASGGDGAIRQIFHQTVNGVELYKPVLKLGIVDDERIVVPGIAIADGHLLISNFYPLLRKIPDVIAGRHPSMRDHRGFQTALSYAPDELLLAGVLDHDKLDPYLRQSVSGWAHQQTRPNDIKYTKWNAEARAMGVKLGKVGPALERFIDKQIEIKERAAEKVDFPTALGTYRERLENFKDLLTSTGFFVENEGGRVRIQLRVDPKVNGN